MLQLKAHRKLGVLALGFFATTNVFSLRCATRSAPPSSAMTESSTRSSGATSTNTVSVDASAQDAASANTDATASEIAQRIDPLEDERVSDNEPLPPAPSEPVIPTSVAPSVQALFTLVERTAECGGTSMQFGTHRVLHPPHCDASLPQLERGGAGIEHAIGRYLLTQRVPFDSSMIQHWSRLLLSVESRNWLAYVLRLLHSWIDSPPEPTANERRLLELRSYAQNVEAFVALFERATGVPVDDRKPWEFASRDDVSAFRPAVIRALRFWRQYGSRESEWPTLSQQRIQLWLAADDARVIRAATLVMNRNETRGPLGLMMRLALERVIRSTRSGPAASAADRLLLRLQRLGP
jgi:hypothetical protein